LQNKKKKSNRRNGCLPLKYKVINECFWGCEKDLDFFMYFAEFADQDVDI